jgi:hypothetical protein
MIADVDQLVKILLTPPLVRGGWEELKQKQPLE